MKTELRNKWGIENINTGIISDKYNFRECVLIHLRAAYNSDE
jgi:hypothetical protein